MRDGQSRTDERSEHAASIADWPAFGRHVRGRRRPLLARLDDFPDSVLVTGCQRSGTTMLARIISESSGMADYGFGSDDELDAALILAGVVDHEPLREKRYCFQTTYVNERYPEYLDCEGRHRIIWVIRNPYSVVYSMCYNWKSWALEELFTSCGVSELSGLARLRYAVGGRRALRQIERACHTYLAKSRQLTVIRKALSARTLLVVDYDQMIRDPGSALSAVFRFIGLPLDGDAPSKVHANSLEKARNLHASERRIVERSCHRVYMEIRQYATGR